MALCPRTSKALASTQSYTFKDVKHCNRVLRVLRDKKLVDKARDVYGLMDQYGIKPNTVTYNTMLDSFFKEGKVQQAQDLFLEMQIRGCYPNDITYNVLINGFSKNGELKQAKGLIREMSEAGLQISAYTYNPLIYAYFKEGLAREALCLSKEMETRDVFPTVTTHNTIMHGLCKLGKIGDARQQFLNMLKNTIPDIVSYNILIYGCCRIGNIDGAFLLFDELKYWNLVPTVVTYNTLIDGLCRFGHFEFAQKLKENMIDHGIHPDVFTYTILKSLETCKMGLGNQNHAEKAQNLIGTRLCNPNFIFKPLSDSPDTNYSKLKFIISSSITEGCNNSILLLGPRGSGKIAVLELVLIDLLQEHPDAISIIRLTGLLHCDDICAFKEIARQLCTEHHLLFSKMASFDDNSQFMVAMLRECGLAHKTIIFALDEFDLFAQGKQRLIYSLLDAMQSVTSQAVVIGVSCRLDADQLLEKRVRSRFSHRKLLFLPPSKEDVQRLLEHILFLPADSNLPNDYTLQFNARLQGILADNRFKEIISTYLNSNSTINHILRFLFIAISSMEMKSGFLSLENFKTALSSIQRQPKQECIKDCSILELYILVCMKRLEVKEQKSYNFNTVMKEYKSVQDSFQTSDCYARNVCLRAFEHVLQRELICFLDSRGHGQSIEFRPVKLLISYAELQQGLKSYRSCPAILLKLMDR